MSRRHISIIYLRIVVHVLWFTKKCFCVNSFSLLCAIFTPPIWLHLENVVNFCLNNMPQSGGQNPLKKLCSHFWLHKFTNILFLWWILKLSYFCRFPGFCNRGKMNEHSFNTTWFQIELRSRFSENCSLCVRCEDMVDVRRLKMLQMVQLYKCEEDALQVSNSVWDLL